MAMHRFLLVLLLAGCSAEDDNLISCDTLADCPSDFAACVEAVCLKRHELPDGFFDEPPDMSVEVPPECVEHEDCPEGQGCDDEGSCQKAACREDADCEGIAECLLLQCEPIDCAAGRACPGESNCAAGVCVPRADCADRRDCDCALGAQDCPAGSFCDGNHCQRVPEECPPGSYPDPEGPCIEGCQLDEHCGADDDAVVGCDRTP